MSEFENMNLEIDDLDTEDVPFEEAVEEPEETGEDLETLNEDEGQPEENEGSETRKEPGYVQGRISKAVAKAEERFNAQLEQLKAQYAPMLERMQELEAQELVRSGKIKDLETAKELVRLRSGQPAQNQMEEQPRQSNGQFAPKRDPATEARISELEHQADSIAAQGGPDVIAEFQKNERIRAKVVSGEMNFYDVADYLKKKSSRRVPPAMRSPNGASSQSPNAIDSMSDEQFDRMERKIQEGARYRLS